MESTIHKIDPNGDTLLILSNPNAPFAVGDASNSWPNALPKYRTEKMRKNERELMELSHAEQSTTDSEREVYFQLSSKHLTLASEYFRGLMANNWREASSSRDFAYSVAAEDWDEAALLIVMNIIHCQTTEIPQTVDLEMLAKIAVIVDYYKCHKAASFYADIWTKNLGSKEISTYGYGRKLLLRLFTSCVFLKATDFWHITYLIIRESRGPIHSLGLPFPQNIVDALENERKTIVSGVISGLFTLLEELISDSKACSFECSSLGALMRDMKGMNLLEPRPSSPFEGYSFVAMDKALDEIQEPNYGAMLLSVSEREVVFDRIHNHAYTCLLWTRVIPIIKAQGHKIHGLVLSEYINIDGDK